MKKVIVESKEASYMIPREDCVVTLKYKASLPDGTVLQSVPDLSFTLGEETVSSTVESIVESMRKGEQCVVDLSGAALQGWPAASALLTPPPASTQHVQLDLTLSDYVEPVASYTMSTPDKLSAGTKRKELGNTFFRAEKFAVALKKYKKAIGFVDDYSSWEGDDLAKGKEIKLQCLLNSAACSLKLKKLKDAVEDCTKALGIEKNNVKALFRRGCAYVESADWEAARSDLQLALKLDALNDAVKKELRRLADLEAAQNKADRARYAGMFDRLNALEDQEKKSSTK